MSGPPTRTQLEAALRASEARLGAVVANAPVILFATDQHGVFTLSEGRGRDALGLSPGEGLGLSVRDVFAGFPEVVANVERALSGHTFTATVDVAGVVFETWYAPWCDTDGTVIGMIGVASEVRSFAASRAEAARAIEEARFGALVEHLTDLITVLDGEGRILYASPSVSRLLGPELQRPLWRLVHPDDLAGVRKAMTELLAEPGRMVRFECRLRAADGEWRYFDSMTTNLLEDPAVRGFVCNTRDITEHKNAEAELARQAYHDDLTGLPNRALFLDRLNMALARSSRRRRGSVAVLFLDVDRFKVINDSLGHAPGDRLLEAVARRLEGALRPSDTVARFGGDEFTILCEDLTTDLEPFTIAERIGRALALPFALDDREVFLTVSIGIAVATDETAGADTLLRDADAAMYRAKERGRARYEVFDEAMRSRAMERMEMEHDLHRAIDRDQLTLRYQPIVDLGTGAVVGAEALLRWRHPRRGLMQPSSFIPLAEETGLIVPIGEWALVEAVRQAGEWRRAGLRPDRFSMSVNLSAGQLLQPRLGQAVDEALAKAAIEPASLWLEITESTLMEDADAAIATLTRFKERGLSLSIDDFGTGFSSLSYLRRLPIDALKIDQSFVRDLGSGEEGHAIAEAVVALAHTLRLGAVAEGVETHAQLAQLRLIGCDSAQGFLFSAPLPSDAIEHLLLRQPRW